jgi:hypothetical protein
MRDPIICPKCKRRFSYDYCLAVMRLWDQSKGKPPCDHCKGHEYESGKRPVARG